MTDSKEVKKDTNASKTTAPSSSSSILAPNPELDLTNIITPFLDRHLVLPLLEFLEQKKMYPEKDLTFAKLQLSLRTKMADLAAEEYRKLHTDTPKEIQLLRASALSELKELRTALGPLLKLLDDKAQVEELQEKKLFTMDYLAKQGIKDSQLDTLYKFAKLMYDGGRYQDASYYLNIFRTLSKDEEKRYCALWGRISAEILMANWDVAFEELKLLRDTIDQRITTPSLVQLQERTWLIHWSLFIFFRIENGPDHLLDFFLQDRLLNAIQTTCPHILRYLTAAVIIHKRRKTSLRDIVKAISQEREVYSDPLTEFLRSLYSEFDFDTAHKRLKEAEQLCLQDYFLAEIKDLLMDQARQFVFETYARTHQCIDMSLLAKRLEIPEENAEQKIVELIRNVRVDVKIDSKKNQLLMDPRYPSIYQQVIDKTENLSSRTAQLAQQVEKRLADS
eukprot:TRINITY_DN1772_c0_g1_i1.p1 TRINITY_DN1772_c0_g1~~TRINITY_DN1772_c0_g1_i1.p1  ORF type:complete len:462 (-),score=84.57 TRINITY_DN1772_c0_g1_i1:48-1394(-)